MDDMELLKNLRSRVETAGPPERASARRRLEAAISRESISGGAHSIKPLRAPRSHRTRSAIFWGLAAASIATLVVLLTLGPSPIVSPARAAAVEALTVAADSAGAAPASPEEGRYRYTKSKTSNLVTHLGDEPYSFLVRSTREIWIAPDGSGVIRETSEEPRFLGERDRARWVTDGRPSTDTGTQTTRFGPGELHYEDLSGLPTDPDELYEVLSDKASQTDNSHDAAMLTAVADLLHETAASPELRQALYEVAARIPGIEHVGERTDSAGRTGTVVAITTDDFGPRSRTELIFEEETSQLLGQRLVFLERSDTVDHQPPTTISSTLYLASGVTDTSPPSSSA